MCWRSSPCFSIGKRPRCTCKMWSCLLDLAQLLVLDKGADAPLRAQSRQATQQRQHANSMQEIPSGGHRSEATSASTALAVLPCLHSVRPRHWPKASHRSRCHAVPCPAAERATFTPCKAVLAVSQTRILASPARTVYYLQPLDAVIAGEFDCSRAHQEFNQTDSRMFRLFRTQTHTSNSMSSFGYNQTPVSVLQASKHSHLLT